MDKTKVYNQTDFNDTLVLESLKKVYQILKKRGYNPINQIVGYLMSGDPGYITNFEGARTLITNFDRSKILEIILKEICDT